MVPSYPEPELAKQLIVHKIEPKNPKTRRGHASTSREIETPKQGFIPGIEEDDDDDNHSVKEGVEETYG